MKLPTPMPKYLHIPTAIFFITLLASCAMEGPCEGTLVLTNSISDVTVAVGDTVYLDLANPPVFISSKGEVTYTFRELVTGGKTGLNRASNPNDDGKQTLLVISGRLAGTVVIELSATSGCLENYTLFNVTVQ
jgi:hypothetical protein